VCIPRTVASTEYRKFITDFIVLSNSEGLIK